MPFILHQPATLQQALQHATMYLQDSGIENTRLNVEWIFSHELACARLELASRYNQRFPPQSSRSVQEHVNRMASGEPLQYVLEETEFMGRRFQVDRRCLIPRPETEQLAEWVLGCSPLWSLPHPAMTDVGTGSGCIIITLALARSHGLYQASDIAPAVLEPAHENAVHHGISHNIRFYTDNLLNSLLPHSLDAIVSNPPYIPTQLWTQLSPLIRDYEPRTALDGGSDGLAVIRPLIAQSAHILKPGGRLFMEIGEDQAETVRHLLLKNGFVNIKTRNDFAEKTRFITAQRQNS